MNTPPRRIFDLPPGSWRELEERVAQVFQEMGCRVAKQKTLKTPRGSVTVDVAIRDQTVAPHSLYICECKYWTKRVSQSEIHAFRTVVMEVGANRGLLISSAGFQPGAVEAATFTNIDLLTWAEFEELMFDRWLAGTMKRLGPLLSLAARLISCSNEDLWKLRECTEASWNELETIAQRYQLIISWAVFYGAFGSEQYRHHAAAVVGLGPASGSTLQPVDTYRRLVDEAPSVCREAISELIDFWGISAEHAEEIGA